MPAIRSSKLFAGLLVGGAAVAASVYAYARYLRPRHLRWGATDEEVHGVWPGDALAPQATSMCTHAITIDAPADAVWRWIVQLGQDRAGFYSYSWLENLIGANITNIPRIVPEFQDRQVGDTVWMAPKDRYAGEARLIVAQLEPGRSMVLVSPEDYDRLVNGERAKGCWALILQAIDNKTTRFIARGRGQPAGMKQIAFDKVLFEPAHFVMERKMMLTIKRLAEQQGAVTPAAGHKEPITA